MNLDNLNKHQVILTALLVSFVASIATGIVTVSLVNQAPPPVTQTINRIIQTTVEKVVPASNGAAVAKETVIVKSDDATIAAISKANQSIVRVYAFTMDGAERFAGLGVIATSTKSKNIFFVGKILTYNNQTVFKARLSGGNVVSLIHIADDPKSDLAVFYAERGVSPIDFKVYTGALFANSDDVKLGQTVIGLGGQNSPFISTGIISSLDSVTVSPTSNEEIIKNIRANIVDEELLRDAILINLSGNIVGFKTGDLVSDGFIPSNDAIALVNRAN